jgi:hypothetical protein
MLIYRSQNIRIQCPFCSCEEIRDASGPLSSNLSKLIIFSEFSCHSISLPKNNENYKCYIPFDRAESTLQNPIQGLIRSRLLLGIKIKIQNFTANFQTNFLRYFCQNSTIFRLSQKNENGF